MQKLFLLLAPLVALTACSPVVTNTPPAAPQLVQIAYTPTMRPFVKKLHQCALEHPEISLITQETSITELASVGADVTLWFGYPPQGIVGPAFSLGVDEIVVIAGPQVALRNIDTEQLRDWYTSPDPTYQVWTYGESNELRVIFDAAILGEASVSSFALIAPNPTAMIEAISTDPTAIGYLPQSWLSEDLPGISIGGDLGAAFERPILVLSHTEPEGNLRSYLVCLQNAGS